MIVIGLTGSAGAGKDTAGRYLAETYRGRTLSFAGHLRTVVQAAIPSLAQRFLYEDKEQPIPGLAWDTVATLYRHSGALLLQIAFEGGVLRFSDKHEHLEQFNGLVMAVFGRAFAEHGPVVTGRRILQLTGSDIFRTLDENVWINHINRALTRFEGRERPALSVLTDVRLINESDLLRNVWKGEVWRIELVGPGATVVPAHHTESGEAPIDRVIINDKRFGTRLMTNALDRAFANAHSLYTRG